MHDSPNVESLNERRLQTFLADGYLLGLGPTMPVVAIEVDLKLLRAFARIQSWDR